MSIPKRALAAVAVVPLVAAVVLLGVGYAHRGDRIGELNRRVASAAAAAAAARASAANADATATHKSEEAETFRAKYARAQDKIVHPRHGRIPSKTFASLSGSMDRFAPTGTSIVALQPLSPVGRTPEQVVVVWRGPDYAYGARPDSGLLLWQAEKRLAPGTGLYQAYFKWHVVFDWHYDGTKHVEYVGPPGNQRTHRNPPGESFSFAVGDVTADGHADVLASLDSSGTGGCHLWRVLSTGGGSTRTIFKRSTCETHIVISNGGLQVDAAIHRPGCSIHGCGDTRRTLLRWSGSGWVVVGRSESSE